MRQRRARKTKIEIYPKDDPRRWGPGHGSTEFIRWYAKLNDLERLVIARWERS